MRERVCEITYAETRSHFLKGDTVTGKSQKFSFVTLAERRNGFALVRKVKTRHSQGVAKAIGAALKPLKRLVRNSTFDNGLGFAQHARVAAVTGGKIYFADPYSSWQRGTNENWNGLLRQYIPEKSCFARVTELGLSRVEKLLNSRVRKRLNWLTPRKVLFPSAKHAGVAFTS